MTLLEFLREYLKLTGTKNSCTQGGCGACTVTLTTFDSAAGGFSHRAVNACLRPVLSCIGQAITTTEGIGSRDEGYHPAQQRIADCNGSQCGFCTPGQVMTLYSLLREKGEKGSLSLDDIEERFDGNICRCTGYRPIMTAAHTFASEGCDDLTAVEGFSPEFEKYDPSAEAPPPAGAKDVAGATTVCAADGTAWHRVTSVAELDAVRSAAVSAGKKAQLVCGNTMTGPCKCCQDIAVSRS